MKVYLVQDAPASMRWQASQAEAKKLQRCYGGEISDIRVAEEGREQLAEFLNGRELFASPHSHGLTPDEIRNSNTPEAQAAAKRLMAPIDEMERVVEAERSKWNDTRLIEDFILNEATVDQVSNIFGCIGTRFAEARGK